VVAVVEQDKKKHIEKQVADKEQLANISEQQGEVIRNKLEEAEKKHYERQSEQELLAQATELADENDESAEQAKQTSPAERRRGAPSRKQLQGSFKGQMKNVQTELGPSEKLISKLIHLKVVEKVSDATSATIARPNAMLSGSIAAFIAVTILYLVARHYGYSLSGFETITAFCAGWILGLVYDYVSTVFKRRKP